MADQIMRRRTFLKAAAVGGAAAALPLSGCAAPSRGAAADRPGTLRLGVASYSLRNFPLDQAIRMVQALGTRYINLNRHHLRYDLAPAELVSARQQVEAAGLQVVGGGTITFEEDSDEDVRRHFEYARLAGMPLIVATCDPRILPRLERFAQEYDIRVAIHNHGPEDRFYPSPYEALEYIRDMDARMGVCNDIGHTARTGVDVVRSVRDAGPRLLDLHLKDLRDLTDRDSQVAIGDGAMPMPEIFEQLLTMNFQGYANLEYEINPDDPLPGMQRSLAYMRGVLAGLGTRHSAG